MIISVCIPCKNRIRDLVKIMPALIKSCKVSSPVEIMILDYGSEDELMNYVESLKGKDFGKGNFVSYARFTGRKNYHMAHAYNLSVRCSVGDVVIILGTDIFVSEDYLSFIRKTFKDGAVWACPTDLKGIVACTRKEFDETGGYDERFELYGPEDKEFDLRLRRRGGKFREVPDRMLSTIATVRKDKYSNYRKITHKKRKRLMRAIFDENKRNNVLVVNKKEGWGRWFLRKDFE